MMETAIVETLPCPVCGERGAIEVRTAGLAAWMQGALITDAFPEFDADQRELLMTGTHAHCWEVMWAGFDDDEEVEL
jgi:sarcosine oxidase delta subunit